MVPPSMHCAEGSRSATLRGKRPVEVIASEALLRRRSPRLIMMEQSWTGGQRGAEPAVVNENVGGSTRKRGRGGGGEVRGGKQAARRSMAVENGEVGGKEVEGATGEEVKEESVEVGAKQMPELKPEDITRMSDEGKVKATVKLFNKTFLYCVREEEKRCGKQRVKAESSREMGSNREARKSNQASLLAIFG